MANNEINNENAKTLSDQSLSHVIGGVNVTPEQAEAAFEFIFEDSEEEAEAVVGKRGPNARIIRRR